MLDAGCSMLDKIRIKTFKNQYPATSNQHLFHQGNIICYQYPLHPNKKVNHNRAAKNPYLIYSVGATKFDEYAVGIIINEAL